MCHYNRVKKVLKNYAKIINNGKNYDVGIILSLIVIFTGNIFHMRTSLVILLVFSAVAAGAQHIQDSRSFETNLRDGQDFEKLQPMNDGEHFTLLVDANRIVRYSYATGDEVDILFSVADVAGGGISSVDDYLFSPDEQMILLTTGKEKIYRYSFTAEYFIWDRAHKTLRQLSENGRQQLATFSPDNRYIAFVRTNNLFLKDLAAGVEKQVTFDGEHNYIINGATDWVYEEEFGFPQAYAWSPDGKKLAYYRFDESNVRLFSLTSYGDLYPAMYQYKYPKAGEENSLVTLHVYDLQDGVTVDIRTGGTEDQYITGMEWTTDPEKLSCLRMNRLQNRLDLLFADVHTGEAQVILTEEETEYIAQPDEDKVTFLKDGKHFLFMNEADGYRHIYLYDMNGKLVNQVTKGSWDVNEFLGYDPLKNQVYYSSCEESSINQGVYRIGVDGENKKKISRDKGWNTASFSKGFRYYVHFHSSATTPAITNLHEAGGKKIKVLQDNREMAEYARTTGLGTREFLTVKGAGQTDLNAYIIKPVNFDPGRKYPLFMYVYGGPESQEVKDEWDYEQWFNELVPMGYIVACVDNRGTGGKGEAFRKCTYMKLGELETADQVAAALFFSKLPYVDKDRIGIYGWSYGGYMTALCMTRGNGIFRVGIAVAPVTNWKYYDSIYTERYMRTPQENKKGYEDNSPLNHASELQGKFLLVHGMSDDNVHLQNSVDFVTALVEADKQFDMMFYPNQNHGIGGGNSRNHLYRKMFEYVLTNL